MRAASLSAQYKVKHFPKTYDLWWKDFIKTPQCFSCSPILLWLLFFLRWHQWWISHCPEVELLQATWSRVWWHHKAPYCHSWALNMFPPSSSLFLSSSLSRSSRLTCRREREIAGVRQGLLTVRIWLQCVNCFILKTLKLMPVCTSGGLLSMCASAFLKVESGGMEVGRNCKEVEENCDHFYFSMVFVEESEHPAPRYGCVQTLSSLC